ncbi:Solitary outer membrane autotransporter beta-barrel domain [Vibrio sinaloensis]|nr:Solitary outer membrane autotransporter beta-barrel domain [Vibrio sinaloensis]
MSRQPTISNGFFTRFSVVRSRQDFSIFSNEAKDHNDEYILGGYAAYQYQFSLNEQWSVTPSIGVHLQYFKKTTMIIVVISRR